MEKNNFPDKISKASEKRAEIRKIIDHESYILSFLCESVKTLIRSLNKGVFTYGLHEKN